MWESQVLLTDGQVVFPQVLRFSPTFDERSSLYKWNILERAVKPKLKRHIVRRVDQLLTGKIFSRWHWKYICSAQNKNRYNSGIVLRKVRILTLSAVVGILTLRKTISELLLRKIGIGTKWEYLPLWHILVISFSYSSKSYFCKPLSHLKIQ